MKSNIEERKASGAYQDGVYAPSLEPPMPTPREKKTPGTDPRVIIHDPGKDEEGGEDDRVSIGRI
ncbi:MAG: hypothetical protein ABII02_04845 [Candidatus Magasanikbacteria bacterium]